MTKTTGSIASSSRVAAASATSSSDPAHNVHGLDRGRSVASRGTNSTNTNNNTTPERMKSRRELEQKIKQRNESRNANYHRTVRNRNRPPNLSEQSEDDVDDYDSLINNKARSDKKEEGPVPKVLRDLLLQTAMFGIDTTARLSKPTLDLTKNMLLPQIVIPLFLEVWENYVPARIQTWLTVVPTSLKNLANLLCDTHAGKALATKAGQLSEDALDVVSSEVARQFWIDATVALINFFESLHTPEVKALLDQLAVGACRLVDVLSSGKAKQVWFDTSDALWALIEVVSDEVMVTSLAEGCAQICFALENERESLKQRRCKESLAQKDLTSQRRRDRDRRQMGTYPPGKAVLRDGEGRDGFDEALIDSLGRFKFEEFEEQMYDGPPQRVIVTTNSSECHEGGTLNEAGLPTQNSAIHPKNRSDDSESEITTEIEDLRCGEDPVDHEEVNKQFGETEKLTPCNNTLSYEQDANGDYNTILQERIDQLNWQSNDKVAASEMHDAFDEPVLQFYRKLNEVLVETRKHSKDLRGTVTSDYQSTRQEEKANSDGEARSKHVDPSPSTPAKSNTGFFRFRKWKLIIVATLLCIATMCMMWFALGCFGLYILVSGGGHNIHQLPEFKNKMQHPSNIVIQIMSSDNQECDATQNKDLGLKKNKEVASISWEEWNEMKLGVEKAIGNRNIIPDD